MQFLSQSLGWADNIILAMAPLGIITIIVAAIRAGGPLLLRAIIGRARESRATAEAELMSSTSNEVCELWDGEQIVRVAGEAPICEFIIQVPEGKGEKETKGDPAGTGKISMKKFTKNESHGKILELSNSEDLNESGDLGKKDLHRSQDPKHHSQWNHRLFLCQSDFSH
jgi:hypothetical protein